MVLEHVSTGNGLASNETDLYEVPATNSLI